MHIPDAPAFDVEQAIWNKDGDELQRALDAGWHLPYARVRDVGMVVDYTLATRIISLRWAEGWEMMARAFPVLHQNPTLWQLALRQAVPGVIRNLLDHGWSATARLESGQSPLNLLTESMGKVLGEPIPDEALIESIEVLVDSGASLTSAYPGVFVPGDLSARGHTLWTRSISYGRWALVAAFMPTHWNEFLGMPRAFEALDTLRRTALGGEAGAQRCWKAWAEKFLEPWLAMKKEDPFSSLVDIALVPSLSPALRHIVWGRWQVLDEAGWSSLHDVALLAREPVVHQAIRCAVLDGAGCLDRWLHAAEDGLRPADLWELANGRSAPSPFDAAADTPEMQATLD